MAVNTALMNARKHAGLSQGGLARRIRETGHRLGYANECSRGNVSRWEQHGTQPQPHYVLILENVLGRPAASLGFHDINTDELLAGAGLDVATPVPEPSARGYGPLTGIWVSRYEYHSDSRDADLSSSHHVQLLQRGAHLNIRSLPRQHSRLSLDLTVNGQWVKGVWTEVTSQGGYYAGAVYDGVWAGFLDPTGKRMAGKWSGYGRNPGELNDGLWSFTMVADRVDADARQEWDREPAQEHGLPGEGPHCCSTRPRRARN
jgi:transcriptional regulator with XRE-family HTH domain